MRSNSDVEVRYSAAIHQAGIFAASWSLEEQDEIVAMIVQLLGLNRWEESQLNSYKAAVWDGSDPEESDANGAHAFSLIQIGLFVHQAVAPNVSDRRRLWECFRFFQEALFEAFEVLEVKDLNTVFFIAEEFRRHPQDCWPRLAMESFYAKDAT